MAATGCEPAPPRLQITVDSTATGADADPGDGACATVAGRCTLEAALTEGGLSPTGSDITLPAGTYRVGPVVAPGTTTVGQEVQGDIRINWGAPRPVELRGTMTVLPGSKVAIEGVNTDLPTPPTLVWGLTVKARGAVQVRSSGLNEVLVSSGGSAVLDRSLVLGEFGSPTPVENRGTLVAQQSSFLGHPGASVGGAVVIDNVGGVAVLRSSVVATPDVTLNGGPNATGGTGTCSGAGIISGGHVHAEASCGPAADGDATGDTDMTRSVVLETFPDITVSTDIVIPAGSPVVDAIPLGHPACDTTQTDLFGTPRGVDGDGDGTGGCDIGAIERPAPAA